jgi:LysW-gamma-L-lysine carboxypeptidase
VEEGVAAEAIVIGEPTGTFGVAVSYRGSLSVRVRAYARGRS